MPLKKSTKIWMLVCGGAIVATAAVKIASGSLGCLGVFAAIVAFVSGAVLLAKAVAAGFRATVRRLTLRLAFSYFLIGIVPIPLLAMLLFTAAYLLAHQFVATRVRREATAVTHEMAARGKLPAVRVADGIVEASDVAWLKVGEKASWAANLTEPRPLIGERRLVWMAARRSSEDPNNLVLVPMSEGTEFVQLLADRTGYPIRIESGRARQSRGGLQVGEKPAAQEEIRQMRREAVRPRGSPAPTGGVLDGEWVGAVYVEKIVFPPSKTDRDIEVVVYIAKTSPRVLAAQLFAQGIPALGRIFQAVLLGLSFILLIVYLIALAIAFALVGSIVRNVNRLTRASEAIARGDFSVRVQSKSRDQIGDLARAFDGMAASIEGLLVQTAEKERLESEIAIARTIQQKLLPAPEASLPGVSVLADFQPVAALGGDYYDYLRMPDGRSAVTVGDVSGHGLATGLLVAMAKAGLSTLIESGLSATPLFIRLNDLIHRSTDSRNYMTLAFFAYDPASRRGELTNAGQLAPYRLSSEGPESLSLPSFPLGLSERSDFPTKVFSFSSGDCLVFVTDGIVEASNEEGDPFGFERLEALLRAEASSNAHRLRDAILAAVAAHTGEKQQEDDRTLVILRLE